MMLLLIPPPGSASTGVRTEPESVIRITQIIWGAMLFGVTIFLLVTLITPGQPMRATIAYAAVLFSLLAIIARFTVPNVVAAQQLKRLSNDEIENARLALLAIYQTRLIIAMAILEGASFFTLITYLVERQWWSLALLGLLMLLMAMMFPSLGRFEAWADDAKRERQNQF